MMDVVITCENCHAQTSAIDYCTTCGAVLAKPAPDPSAQTAALRIPAQGAAEAGNGATPGVCPHCGTVRKPGEKYCEVCGFEFATGSLPAPPPPPHPVEAVPGRGQGSWRAVIGFDRKFFESFGADQVSDVVFPEGVAPREVRLEGQTFVIGRRRSSGDERPGIDLSGPSGDPCVSRRHAVLVAQADGSWTVTDTHSANGTWVNAATAPLPPDQPMPLRDGDRIFVGAFTVITMRYDPGVTP